MQSKIVFREMLSELKALADVQGNYLTKEDIKKRPPKNKAVKKDIQNLFDGKNISVFSYFIFNTDLPISKG